MADNISRRVPVVVLDPVELKRFLIEAFKSYEETVTKLEDKIVELEEKINDLSQV